MDWFSAVDIYCERLAPSYWAEPVNALSNLAFPAAAFWAALTARQTGTDAAGWLLIGLGGLIGVGSFLFHTHAVTWAELADMVPIWGFVGAYVLAVVLRMQGRPVPVWPVLAVAAAAGLGFGWQGLTPPDAAADAAPDPFNGSLAYAPAVIAQAVFVAMLFLQRHPHRGWVLAALLTFLVSLTFRTIDLRACAAVPLGTHFLWHILNGLMIGLLLQFYLRLPPSRPPPPPPAAAG